MSVRTGFIARGFIPFSTHVVSFGYGGVSDDLYPLPPVELPTLIPGTSGPAPRGVGTRRAPCFSTEGPAVVEAVEPVPWVSGETPEAPSCVVEGPSVEAPSPEGVPLVQGQVPPAPGLELEVEGQEEGGTGAPEVAATTPGAPAPVPEKKQG